MTIIGSFPSIIFEFVVTHPIRTTDEMIINVASFFIYASDASIINTGGDFSNRNISHVVEGKILRRDSYNY